MTTGTLAPPASSRLLEVALIYADLGWPVFPCKPRGKTPITEHGLKDASTDLDQIGAWWDRTPDANVAIATGVAFDVLDVDVLERDEVGNVIGTPLDAWLPNDSPLIAGPTVATGKGAHVYFATTGIGNRAGVIPGVDWRGQGGYVIAPPSVHPNGAIYRFERGSNDPEYGVWTTLSPPAPWLFGLLKPKKQSFRSFGSSTTTSSAGAYARRALENECGRVMLAAEGTRNHTLNSAAFSLGQLVATGSIGVDEVIEGLLLAASRAGLDETESRATVASGLNSGALQPRSVQ